MFRPIIVRWIAVAALICGHARLPGAVIEVPGGSFESPKTPFVSINIDHWQKTAKPDWYVETNGFTWAQLSGAFKNTPVGSRDHIDNCHGDQAVWIFAVPEAGLFQDAASMDWNDPAPSGDFAPVFEPGSSYRLTVAVLGGGGGMLEGVPLELALYYLDDATNRTTVAAITVRHDRAVFPTNTHLVDFHVDVPQVKTTDPWAGRPIGIRLVSTVETNQQGGYWDLDHVRLTRSTPPVLETRRIVGDQFEFSIESEPGRTLEVWSAFDPATPADQWTKVASLTNETGSIAFSVPTTNGVSRFYRASELP